jgi:hypothetical protein
MIRLLFATDEFEECVLGLLRPARPFRLGIVAAIGEDARKGI